MHQSSDPKTVSHVGTRQQDDTRRKQRGIATGVAVMQRKGSAKLKRLQVEKEKKEAATREEDVIN